MSVFGVLVIGSIIGTALLSSKSSEIDILNEVLKNNLKIKHKDKEVYPYVYKKAANKYLVHLPDGFGFSELLKVQEKIENVLKCHVVIKNDDFIYSIQVVEFSEIPTNVPFKIINTRQKANKGVLLALGEGDNGLVYLDLKKAPHTLIAGSTGYGKSIFIKNLILQLISNYENIELELFDFKAGVELKDFKNLKQTKCFISKPHLAANEIQRIHKEIDERFDLITNADCRDIYEYNDISKSKLPTKIVILEEFTILIDMQKDISTTLIKSLAISGACGVHFICTSQRFDSKIIDSKIKANVDNRICFRTADSINSKLILDESGAEKLKNVGRAILSQNGERQEFQSFYVTKKDIQSVTSKYYEFKNFNNEVEAKISTDEGAFLWG